MPKRFTGVPVFDPEGRFQGGRRSRQRQQPADAAAVGGQSAGLSAPPAAPAPSNNSPTGTPPQASASGSVDLSKLVQSLQKLNITPESTRPNMPTLAEALRRYFGDQAQIDVDGQKIKVTTTKGVRQLEVYTRPSKGKTVAYLGLRVDERTLRPIGQLFRYGDEYYIDADSLKKIDGKKPPLRLPKSFLYGTGVLAAGGAAVGLSRFLGGGDDDDEKKKQVEGGGGAVDVVPLESGTEAPPITTTAPTTTTTTPTTTTTAPTTPVTNAPAVTVTERQQPNIVFNVPPPQVIREITSGEAPVETRRKGNETVVKAGTSDGVFTLNIGPDKTLILKDKEVVGEFPTSDIIRAVGQMADGKTEREIKRSGEFDDLLKNPWFFVAIALALIAFTQRRRSE